MSTDNNYFRIKASGISRHDEDDFTTAAFAIGADGVAEDLVFKQKDLRYDPDIIETPELDMNIYFAKAPGENEVIQLQAQFPQVRIELVKEENRDWMHEWKKGFKPFLFAKPFWVVPAWLTAPLEAGSDTKYHVFVEPGMAFGTGTHETTRLAASLVIEEVNRPETQQKPETLLDVGTGTAILALIAYRLGVPQCVGIDIDPEACRTARENLERNNATAIQIPDDNLEDIKDSYDLVIANIIDGVLTILRHDLVRVLKPGGRMILSGVLMDRESEFYEGFTKDTGLRVLKKISEGEWSAALLERAKENA